jgi:hypothetical protein
VSDDARIVRNGDIEVRLHADGTLDEVVVYGPDGRCWYHLEQMTDAVYWMRFYAADGGQDLVVNIQAVTGPRTDDDGKPAGEGPVVRAAWEWD